MQMTCMLDASLSWSPYELSFDQLSFAEVSLAWKGPRSAAGAFLILRVWQADARYPAKWVDTLWGVIMTAVRGGDSLSSRPFEEIWLVARVVYGQGQMGNGAWAYVRWIKEGNCVKSVCVIAADVKDGRPSDP